MREFDLGAVTAYALAVKNGFEGTEQDWLASLVPDLSIGEVKTLEAGSSASATMDGTAEKPVLNLSLPRGESGHAADWKQNDPAQPDYVQNRTHYEETDGSVVTLPGKYLPKGMGYIENGTVEILPEYTITSEGELSKFPALGLVEGKTYIVKLGDVEYTCVAGTAAMPEFSFVYLGDIYTYSDGQFGLTATGEPFVLMEVSPDVAAVLGTVVAVYPLAEIALPIAVSIVEKGEIVQKLDNRCLDFAWLPINNLTELVTLSLPVTEKMYDEDYYIGYAKPEVFPAFTHGQKYVLVVDGVEHEAELYTANDTGMFYPAGTVPDDDNYLQFGSFGVAFIPSMSMVYVYHVTSGEHTASIFEKTPNRLPAEFLPDCVEAVILRSSTTDSAKRFKLTVDDTGAITATEVTD